MDKRRMQRYYWAMLGQVSLVVWTYPDRLNDELKVWYQIETTRKMDETQYYHFIEYTINMFAECFEILFDSDWYKYEWVSYTFIFDNKIWNILQNENH